jgi:class 3 adenylate cyclase
METQRIERRLSAVLAADVAGYSRLVGIDEEGTLARLRSLRLELIDPAIAAHRGRIIKTTGDGILSEFPSVVEAVRCALALQRGMAGRDAGIAADRRIAFRVGIHLGDVVVDGADLLGDGVNIAARLEGIAEPGGICLSEDAWRQVRDKLTEAFVDLGEQMLSSAPSVCRITVTPRISIVSSYCMAVSLSESAPSTRGKGEVPCRRRAAGLRTGSDRSLVPISSRVNLAHAPGRVVGAVRAGRR